MQPVDFKRSVNFISEVKAEDVEKLASQLAKLKSENENEWITLFLASTGGDVAVGFGLYDFVVGVLKPKLQVIGIGKIASMAIPLFLMGEHRAIGRHATIFLHEIERCFEKESRYSLSELQVAMASVKSSRDTYVKIVSERLKCPAEVVEEMMRANSLLSAERAVELGFAHEIIDR